MYPEYTQTLTFGYDFYFAITLFPGQGDAGHNIDIPELICIYTRELSPEPISLQPRIQQ